MGQGSINQSAPQHAGIEGILAALQAVHAVYGIDTQKQQQQLLASQTKKETADAEKASILAQGAKDASEGKNTGASALYYGLVPTGTTAQPANNQATPSQAPNYTPVQEQTVPLKNLTAVNDSIASDAFGPGPVTEHVRKISEFSSPATSSPLLQSKRQLGGQTMLVSNSDGTTTSFGLPPDKQLDFDKKKTDFEHEKQKMGFESQDQKNKIASDYMEKNPDAKSAFEDLYAARGVSKMLLSGNYKGQAAGIDRLKLLAIGVSKLNPAVLESIDPNKFGDIIKEVIAKKTTNGLPPEDLHLLHQTAQLIERNALEKLDQTGSLYADQHAPVYSMDSSVIKNKFLFPKGLQSQVPDTGVAVSPKSQKPTLFYLNKGKMRAVSSQE